MNPKAPKLLEDVRDTAAFVIGATQGRTIEEELPVQLAEVERLLAGRQ